ncbi:MAG TPA: ABC transporter permease [Verrucomicrobiae bacterium]|nr:ABC transporter permease [Verrucomicrobiae bacterium]
MKFLSEFREGFHISWDAVRAHKMRSTLATLGIVIGIVTVTLMAAAIEGLNNAFMRNISSLGSDVFYVQQYSWFNDNENDYLRQQRRRRPLQMREADALNGQLTLSEAIAPVAYDQDPVKYKTRKADSVVIIGTTDGYLQTSGISVADGRFITQADAEGGRPICVIGSEVASNLFRGDMAVGSRIKIEDQSFEVVGVLEKQGSMLGWSLDNRIIVPLREFLKDIWSRPQIEIHVKAKPGVDLDEARGELREIMRHIRHLPPNQPDDFAINQQEQLVKMFHTMTAGIALVGIFITSLSLFVGGIGIMNIMFVSVAERTREIGVRKAIGAKRRSILLQFLIEAACVCLIGGAIGLAIAWSLTFAVRHLFPIEMSWDIVAIAILVSLLTGVISGILPAFRAARMNPVDALRNE